MTTQKFQGQRMAQPSMLDRFAMVALGAFMRQYPDHFVDDTKGAEYCYSVAYAMMAAKEKMKEDNK